jgi:hypothetical protein
MTVTNGHEDRAAPTRIQETEAWQNLARHDQDAARAAVRQEMLVESTAQAIGEFEDISKAYTAAGFPELAADAAERANIAREDNDAAMAGVDYRDLDAHFHGESQATPERAEQFWPCGYPETAAAELAEAELADAAEVAAAFRAGATRAAELAAAERETDLEAGQ